MNNVFFGEQKAATGGDQQPRVRGGGTPARHTPRVHTGHWMKT